MDSSLYDYEEEIEKIRQIQNPIVQNNSFPCALKNSARFDVKKNFFGLFT